MPARATSRRFDDRVPEMQSFDDAARQELIDGLSAARASVPPKYFYDELGCRLFGLITRRPEYYLTRIELSVMQRHADAIRRTVGTDAALIELGAGDCRKARALFPVLQPRQFVAIDISDGYLRHSLALMQSEFPTVIMIPLAADLSLPFDLPLAINGTRRVFFYPGSSIGNFEPEAAEALLARLHRSCAGRGGLLIGVDLVKDEATLHRAYNDAAGITAAFNRNILNHVNTLIGSDFRVRDWQHRALYHADRSRIEMHLDATRDLSVWWPGGGRRFSAGESIHTENSYKYRLDDFQDLLRQAGFADVVAWVDERQWFAVCYALAG